MPLLCAAALHRPHQRDHQVGHRRRWQHRLVAAGRQRHRSVRPAQPGVEVGQQLRHGHVGEVEARRTHPGAGVAALAVDLDRPGGLGVPAAHPRRCPEPRGVDLVVREAVEPVGPRETVCETGHQTFEHLDARARRTVGPVHAADAVPGREVHGVLGGLRRAGRVLAGAHDVGDRTGVDRRRRHRTDACGPVGGADHGQHGPRPGCRDPVGGHRIAGPAQRRLCGVGDQHHRLVDRREREGPLDQFLRGDHRPPSG